MGGLAEKLQELSDPFLNRSRAPNGNAQLCGTRPNLDEELETSQDIECLHGTGWNKYVRRAKMIYGYGMIRAADLSHRRWCWKPLYALLRSIQFAQRRPCSLWFCRAAALSTARAPRVPNQKA
eukprot:6171854-Pleurochrysis_carterae.AAC.2